MDLHPDASLALRKMSRKNVMVRGLAWLSDFVYRHADRVVVLGPYMADRVLTKGVRADRVTTVPVWSRRDEVHPVEHQANPLRQSLGVGDDTLVAMYSGNLGLAHSFDEFLGAARHLRDCGDLLFVFIGGGPRLAEVHAVQEAEGLTNIRILDYVPREKLHLSLSAADVHLISLRPEMTGIVVPGKLYGAMAAARPALFVGPAHCESADTIRRAGCGVTVLAGDVEGVVAALSKLAADRNLGRQMGQKGRMAFLANHERNLCCYQWLEVIRGLVARSPVTRMPAIGRGQSPRMAPAGSLGRPNR
jgi:glycosyltransferase involved in cell wall biosynthesis